jgi:hypothetical protein
MGEVMENFNRNQVYAIPTLLSRFGHKPDITEGVDAGVDDVVFCHGGTVRDGVWFELEGGSARNSQLAGE